MAYTYSQTKQDEEIAILGAYPYRYEFILTAVADIVLNEITFFCKSNKYDAQQQIQDISVTLICGSRSITETVGKNETEINLSMNNYSVARGENLTIQIQGYDSAIISVANNIDTYSFGNCGMLNFSRTLPIFSITYSIISEEWLKDDEINDGYPYYTWALKQDISKEIDPPKPWWVWKTDENINDGYPYIIFWNNDEELFGWFMNGIALTPFMNGFPLNTYFKKGYENP